MQNEIIKTKNIFKITILLKKKIKYKLVFITLEKANLQFLSNPILGWSFFVEFYMARKKVDLEIRDAFRFYIDEEKQRIVAKGLIEDNRLLSSYIELLCLMHLEN